MSMIGNAPFGWKEMGRGFVLYISFSVVSHLTNVSHQYIPSLNDAVIATVLRSTSDSYILAIPSSTSPAPASVQALLPHLAFPQATKKTRPILHPGCTVYARVSLANKHMDPELECYDAESQKAEGFGELKGGMVFNVSLGMARRLLGDGKKIRQLQLRARKAEGTEAEGGEISNGMEVLEELGRVLAFEIAVGRNGRVWVDSEDTKVTLCVGSCIQKSEYLTGDEQRVLVREALRKL
jgi:exosome complex component RRP40